MSATAAATVKAALFTLINGLALGAEVEVGYGPLANPPREWVSIGKAFGPVAPATFRAGGRLPRIEDLSVLAYLGAMVPGATSVEVQAAETRVVEIYTEIVNAVAVDPTLAGVPGGAPGLKAIWVSRMELDSDADDDAAYAWITLTFSAQTHIT